LHLQFLKFIGFQTLDIGKLLRSGAKALSVRQPWAWAIIHAGKDAENRPLGAIKRMEKRFGEIIFIHAGKFQHPEYYQCASDWMSKWTDANCPPADTLQYGGIIGTARLVGKLEGPDNMWLSEPDYIGIELTDAKPCKFMSCAGQLGLFAPQVE
jgi:hypothetical protein